MTSINVHLTEIDTKLDDRSSSRYTVPSPENPLNKAFFGRVYIGVPSIHKGYIEIFIKNKYCYRGICRNHHPRTPYPIFK